MSTSKTVVDKLNLTKYPVKAILKLPDDIDEFDRFEYDIEICKNNYDLIFIFVFSLEEFSADLREIVDKQLLTEEGYVFFAYPKKNNKKYDEFIDRDSFFTAIPTDDDGYVIGSNIKFARMVSFNEVFTVVGLKSEKKKLKKGVSSANSQCVDHYIDNVSDIKQYLSKNEALSTAFNHLTFGYQKGWARYVYSAKRQETREKRLLEMEKILGEGFKSIDLYRRKKK